MNKIISPFAALVFFSATLASATVLAEADVEQADSLRFQEFFKDKKEAKKIWKEDAPKTNTVKTYDQTSPAAATAAPAAAVSESKPAAGAVAQGNTGQRFEIRERYTLTRSASTPYSAFFVIEPLFKQAAQLCPLGWKKIAERSTPVEQDFYLYYEVECL